MRINRVRLLALLFILSLSISLSAFSQGTIVRVPNQIVLDNQVIPGDSTIIGLSSIKSYTDRVQLFSEDQAYRFELIEHLPFQSGKTIRFEFDRFGKYVCYGDAIIKNVTWLPTIMVVGAIPQLESVSVEFKGSCGHSTLPERVAISGNLYYAVIQPVDICSKYKLDIQGLNALIDKLNAEIVTLKASVSSLTAKLSGANERALKAESQLAKTLKENVNLKNDKAALQKKYDALLKKYNLLLRRRG